MLLWYFGFCENIDIEEVSLCLFDLTSIYTDCYCCCFSKTATSDFVHKSLVLVLWFNFVLFCRCAFLTNIFIQEVSLWDVGQKDKVICFYFEMVRRKRRHSPADSKSKQNKNDQTDAEMPGQPFISRRSESSPNRCSVNTTISRGSESSPNRCSVNTTISRRSISSTNRCFVNTIVPENNQINTGMPEQSTISERFSRKRKLNQAVLGTMEEDNSNEQRKSKYSY